MDMRTITRIPVAALLLGCWGGGDQEGQAVLVSGPSWFRQTVECVSGTVAWEPPNDAVMISYRLEGAGADTGDAIGDRWVYGGYTSAETDEVQFACTDDVEFVYATMPEPG